MVGTLHTSHLTTFMSIFKLGDVVIMICERGRKTGEIFPFVFHMKLKKK